MPCSPRSAINHHITALERIVDGDIIDGEIIDGEIVDGEGKNGDERTAGARNGDVTAAHMPKRKPAPSSDGEVSDGVMGKARGKEARR